VSFSGFLVKKGVGIAKMPEFKPIQGAQTPFARQGGDKYLAIDLDILCSHRPGRGAIPTPIKGAVEFLHGLLEADWMVRLCSATCTGAEVSAWLARYSHLYDTNGVPVKGPDGRPASLHLEKHISGDNRCPTGNELYLSDRCVRLEGNLPTSAQLEEFLVWWKS
jgi:hypothetical protein